MKYVRMFALHWLDVLESRSRSFVWFLISFINPLILLLFWRGALLGAGGSIGEWTLSTVSSYYLLLIIASSFITAHIDEDVAYEDIRDGRLSFYLLRPFPYYWAKFLIEIPYRILQGSFGVIVFIIFQSITSISLLSAQAPIALALSILIIITAYFLSFTFKMILGLTALWTTDFSGLSQLVEVVSLIFGGFVLPLGLFPEVLKQAAYTLPFSYMFYFPILSVQGALDVSSSIEIIGRQLVWLVIMCLTYRFLWNRGIRKFTGIGQ